MGDVGREVIKTDVNKLIDDLNRGVAAEVNDAYRYLLASKLVAGPYGSQLSNMFGDMSQHEWEHMGVLMNRIQQLEGRPMARPSQADQMSYVQYKTIPEDPADVRRLVEDSLEGERAAIRYWEQLYEATAHTDPVTADLARKALADEVEDEDNLERFLAGWQ